MADVGDMGALVSGDDLLKDPTSNAHVEETICFSASCRSVGLEDSRATNFARHLASKRDFLLIARPDIFVKHPNLLSRTNKLPPLVPGPISLATHL